MRILGIDQSYTSSGLVIIADGEVELCEKYSSDKSEDSFARAWDISVFIRNVAVTRKVDFVGIEGLAFGMRGDATRDLAGLQFCIVNLLREQEFAVEVIAPNAVKKFATGNGKAQKQELYEALPLNTQTKFLELGVKKTTGLYDLTDAYWIAKIIEDNHK